MVAHQVLQSVMPQDGGASVAALVPLALVAPPCRDHPCPWLHYPLSVVAVSLGLAVPLELELERELELAHQVLRSHQCQPWESSQVQCDQACLDVQAY
jgi:hypothetical protein